jgi:hypothetical protein
VAFLRFSRDRRGYENTYLLHAARPQGDKEQPRLLYWFRTPPHLKVGRTAFDDDAMRLLEGEHPDVEFDWSRLLESAAAGAAAPPDRNGQPQTSPQAASDVDASPSTDAETSGRGGQRHRRRRGRPPGA